MHPPELPTFVVPVLEWREGHPVVEVLLGAAPDLLAARLDDAPDDDLRLAPLVAWLRPDLLTSATSTAILTLLSWALDSDAPDQDPLPALHASFVLPDPDQPGVLAPVPLQLHAEDGAVPEDLHLLVGQDVLTYYTIQPLDDNRLACTCTYATDTRSR